MCKKIKLNLAWDQQLSDSSSPKFSELKTIAENAFLEILQDYGKYVKKIITSFR